ncbi:hypothetical protein ZWY2020_020926 [Hordeum vulgare]|nr:hypothetical protein ZWY2020_020926 [Hordeum vulgare]
MVEHGGGGSEWEFVPTKPPKARLPNHVIGSLERKYFPGLAKPNDDDPTLPGLTWEHYQHTKDEHGVTMAARVIDDSHESGLGHSVHILEVWKEGHKGKDGAEFYSQSAQERYKTFTEVFQEVHGQDAKLTSKPLDPELLIIAGEGKVHGCHLLCNGAIATSSHRKLHEIHTSSTGSTPSI